MYSEGFNLTHPTTGEVVGIFQGYLDTGTEVWLTANGIEQCKFEGFTDDGWTKWSQNVTEFAKVISEIE